MLKEMIRWHVSNHGPLSKSIFKAAQLYRDGYIAANNYDMSTNGELRLLHSLQSAKFSSFMDVGANHGEWTAAVLGRFPVAMVHAFELSPATAHLLQVRFAGDHRVSVVSAGLSDTARSVDVYHVESNDALTSLNQRPYGISATTIPGQVIRGDEYMVNNALSAVDLLKIDVEGHEWNVLRGLAGTIDQVSVIQFEYNEMSWKCGVFLDNFANALSGFQLGRLTNGGVIWEQSLVANDHLNAGNLVAVQRCRGDLINVMARF